MVSPRAVGDVCYPRTSCERPLAEVATWSRHARGATSAIHVLPVSAPWWRSQRGLAAVPASLLRHRHHAVQRRHHDPYLRHPPLTIPPREYASTTAACFIQ